MTIAETRNSLEAWPRCPQAALFFESRFQAFAAANPPAQQMAERFLRRAGVNIVTLVDHWVLPETDALIAELTACGLVETQVDGGRVWEHPRARLPRVRLSRDLAAARLALAVEDVTLFLAANRLSSTARLGDLDSAYEEARCPLPDGELAVVARRGYRGFRPGVLGAAERGKLLAARQAFRERDRGGDEAAVLERTIRLAESVPADIGLGRAADEFFAAEREYYMARSQAARWQYARQQELGLGWANHDHHTYRSSRPSFRALMRLWQAFGFEMRERFYAGAEAGWGAQIVEHPISRVVIFSDVDVAPEELDIDFARTQLPPRDTLGTIGLWCALHGSSIAQAGMHHLECEFDFAQARAGFEQAGFKVMAPFTDLPMLKQAFTEAEMWPVAPERIGALLRRHQIEFVVAERFRETGAAGSHLELLQRWDGFKGFNKTGVSAIIRETDARRG